MTGGGVLEELRVISVYRDGFSWCQRCAPTATGVNGNGHFNGMGTAVAPVPVAASAGSHCNYH